MFCLACRVSLLIQNSKHNSVLSGYPGDHMPVVFSLPPPCATGSQPATVLPHTSFLRPGSIVVIGEPVPLLSVSEYVALVLPVPTIGNVLFVISSYNLRPPQPYAALVEPCPMVTKDPE